MFIIRTYKRAQAMNYPTQTDNENKCTTYNGWSNYETWNVALWLDNDYDNYQLALIADDYNHFVELIKSTATNTFNKLFTGDKVLWTDEKLNIQELDEKIQELRD